MNVENKENMFMCYINTFLIKVTVLSLMLYASGLPCLMHFF